METINIFAGIILIALVVLSARFTVHADAWRSSVQALHLRWEREQRQAGPNGVTLAQRQSAQAEFELLVANRPFRMLWLHFALGVAAVVYALVLAWNRDDLRDTGLWLVLPVGVTIIAVLGYAWLLVNQANSKLAIISSTLYGPAPPRVKVRDIKPVNVDSN